MHSSMPTDPIEFSKWDWDQIAPHANGLLRRRLTLSSIDEWLADWSLLARLIAESFNRLYIRTTTHTNDKANHARFRKYSEEVMPKAREFEQRMKTRLLESGLRPKGMAVPLRRMRSDSAIYRPENLALRTKCEALEAEYNELTGSRTFDWDGEKVDQAQVFGKLGDLDRGVRERAWRALAACLESQRAETDRIWVQLLDLRQQMARNAGFKDYRSFHWRELARFDYTPQDCRVFHDGIARVVVPALQRLAEKRKRGLSLDTLRIWDDFWNLRPDSLGRPPLRPFGSAAELTAIAERVFTGVDPELAAYYRILRDEGLLDLEARPHKSPVGYMQELPASKRAFIFTVAVGLHLDVDTHLHESGHAFHASSPPAGPATTSRCRNTTPSSSSNSARWRWSCWACPTWARIGAGSTPRASLPRRGWSTSSSCWSSGRTWPWSTRSSTGSTRTQMRRTTRASATRSGLRSSGYSGRTSIGPAWRTRCESPGACRITS
jgi:oligoendopeptidase F